MKPLPILRREFFHLAKREEPYANFLSAAYAELDKVTDCVSFGMP